MTTLSFAQHCTMGLVIRWLLIIYANYHDRKFSVPYTDVDYRVYTDASRMMVNGDSPYDRHTYRYTPLLASILIPNILLHGDFGKVFFSFIDIVVTILTRNTLLNGSCKTSNAETYALAWLYNPLTIVITTRGNADSLAVLLVLSTLFFLRKENPILAGLLHGLSIHFRLYPIAFSLSMYLSLREKNLFFPNAKQAKLVVACISSLVFFTSVSYYFYGYKYLYESMIYHLMRKDARHNFSVFFYATYLSTSLTINIFKRIITFLPQLLVLVAISLRYSDRKHLPFAIFTQAIVMVAYNPVMTSQYFFWFLSLLPVCLPDIRMSVKRWLASTTFWLIAQGIWLFDAYLLEFQGLNTFHRIWLDGILFFIVNLKILYDMIKYYER
ncbi:GPI mannosyltransferase 1 [Venturia canescens]|uniref:GPI mannosyltransferase 1 n=1 Tax=Venturia canescens TaxID=32260 RepID=UPI001C9C4768|nr:GPI mannosyltransferase 1 [Venturia canescens]